MIENKAKKKLDGSVIRIKQIKSIAKCTKEQIACVKGLGLKKIGDISIVQNNPCILGMIRSVSHLVIKCEGDI